MTVKWLEAADPAGRKSRGQYMTPRPVAEALLDRVDLAPGLRVLDPGVGTGELLRAALDREPGIEATGWDIDEAVIAAAGDLIPEATLELRSALDPEPDSRDSESGTWNHEPGTRDPKSNGDPGSARFDLVIGNPPYFQLRLDHAGRQRFEAVISGRPNIFALFFQVGLEQLRPGGTLAYIVPPSMNSGAYFEALREYLIDQTEITDLTILEGNNLFEGANTAIQLLVLRKKKAPPTHPGRPPDPVGRITGEETGNPTHPGFVFRREVPEAGFRRVVFTPDPALLAAEFEGRRTLWEVGLEAVTGQVVWNQNRDRLKDRPGPGRVPLVWSHSIGGSGLEPGPQGIGQVRSGKPGFYETTAGGRSPLTGPAIVVNRVVGAVGRGELRAALIPENVEFLAENHVNVIRPRQPSHRGGSENRCPGRKSDPLRGAAEPGGSENRSQDRKSDPPVEGDRSGGHQVGVDWEGVLAGLLQPGVAGRVRLLTGNTQISARELTHLVPLDLPG